LYELALPWYIKPVSENDWFGCCLECKKPIIPYGQWKRVFLAPDLRGHWCIDCAKRLAPDAFAEAERAERSTGPFDPDKGL
jgi:hypothetical protein